MCMHAVVHSQDLGVHSHDSTVLSVIRRPSLISAASLLGAALLLDPGYSLLGILQLV